MPRAVVRTVEQCDVPGLITDMQELAEAADGDLAGKLRPLTEAYAPWIAELEARRVVEPDLLGYADALVRCWSRRARFQSGWKRGSRCSRRTRTRAMRFASPTAPCGSSVCGRCGSCAFGNRA